MGLAGSRCVHAPKVAGDGGAAAWEDSGVEGSHPRLTHHTTPKDHTMTNIQITEAKHRARALATEALRVWTEAGFAVTVCAKSLAPVCVPTQPRTEVIPLAQLLTARQI